MQLAFGILAHERLDALEDLVANIRTCCPTASIRLFNGAHDDAWLGDGPSVPVSARSRPMRYLSLASVHRALMCDVVDSGEDVDAVVILDSDMLLLKPGLERALEPLLEHFAYVGADFAAFGHLADTEPARSVMNQWPYWRQVLGAETLYVVFNPGQIFRRDLVEHIVTDRSIEAMLEAVEAVDVPHPEEFVWPTYAVSRGFRATCNPGSHGLQWRGLTPDELTVLWADPNVFLVHKVGMELTDPARQAVRRLSTSGATDDDLDAATARLAGERLWLQTPRSRFKYHAKLMVRDLRLLAQRAPRRVG